MILRCPRCRQKNRLPDDLVLNGEYLCRSCGQILFGATAEDRPGAPTPPHPTARPTTKPAAGPAGRFNDAELRRRLRAVKLPRALLLLNAAYVLVLLTLSVSNAAGPELWWVGSLNLYLPQWLWALPGLFLLPLTLRAARKLALVPLLALLWVFGPLMGFCPHWPASPDTPNASGTGSRLRVMTYNVKWGSRDAAAIIADIHAFHPDLIQFQDSEGVTGGEIGRALAGWNVRQSGQYLVASRLPLPDLESRDISYAGSEHHCIRFLLQVGTSQVAVYDAHLLSPRGGLVSVRHHEIGGLVGNTGDRLEEAARLADYVRAEPRPTLLTGDLNAPVQSLVCRRLFDAGLRDAFSEAGSGYGYSYGTFTGLQIPYVRIDHVLVSRQWQVRHCWVGNAKGSDHRPVIADLALSP